MSGMLAAVIGDASRFRQRAKARRCYGRELVGWGEVCTMNFIGERDGLAAEWEGEPLGFEVSTEPMPQLPDPETPDFWEGPQWEALGFFVQYMWAFGVVFGVSASFSPLSCIPALY